MLSQSRDIGLRRHGASENGDLVHDDSSQYRLTSASGIFEMVRREGDEPDGVSRERGRRLTRIVTAVVACGSAGLVALFGALVSAAPHAASTTPPQPQPPVTPPPPTPTPVPTAAPTDTPLAPPTALPTPIPTAPPRARPTPRPTPVGCSNPTPGGSCP